MTAISQTTFWNAFSWMKSFAFWFESHWSVFLRVYLTISIGSGAEQATSHYPDQCLPSSLTYICALELDWLIHRGQNKMVVILRMPFGDFVHQRLCFILTELPMGFIPKNSIDNKSRVVLSPWAWFMTKRSLSVHKLTICIPISVNLTWYNIQCGNVEDRDSIINMKISHLSP